ncbi:MAG: hypothetical protein EA402_01850 [Planctomycetota bacterium]|nr:MAG: hypothetical protein EA402_01850 [Planctomycetota bacterium]
MSRLSVVSVFVGIALLSPGLQAQDIPTTPGFHGSISCVGAPGQRFNMYLPSAYAEHPDRLFPVLLISSPTAKPHTRRFRDWADEHGFVVIGLLNSRNGPYENNMRNQDAVDATLALPALRMHPHLRYALGGSGGGSSSMAWVARKPDQFAGLHLAIHSGSGQAMPKHLVMSFFARVDDETHPISAIDQAVARYRRDGHVLLYERFPSGGHSGPPAEVQEAHVSWMYWNTLLNHPRHSQQDIQAGWQILGERHARLAGQSDLAKRMRDLEMLLEVASIRASPLGRDFLALWVETLTEQMTTASTELERLWLLVDASEKTWYPGVENNVRREHTAELRALSRQSELRDEIAAFQAYGRAKEMATNARNPRSQNEAAQAFKAIAERFPGTRYGAKAAER